MNPETFKKRAEEIINRAKGYGYPMTTAEALTALTDLIKELVPAEAIHTPYSAQSTWATGFNACRTAILTAIERETE